MTAGGRVAGDARGTSEQRIYGTRWSGGLVAEGPTGALRRAALKAQRAVWGVAARADAWLNRLYGWRHNPLYQSGTLVAVLLGVTLVTGLYLLVFYRVGAPYDSVARITGQVWTGRWIRGLHRYASDAAVLAAVVHLFRMFAQDRSWGPRALAWVSGLVLLFVLFAAGWTGYVMVWDVQGQVLAVEGARFLDGLPIFSEPISRAFVGEGELPGAFFFLNLFLHIALPVGMGLLLWLHVSRVARATLVPPRRLLWGMVGGLLVLSLVWPVGMAMEADPFRVPGSAPFDIFYAFWLPVTRSLPAWAVWAVGGLAAGALVLVPAWAAPRVAARPGVSVVDERLCTGCEQCYLDCPYEAIRMVPRADGPAALVARVDPGLCASCGICAGSCAPMGVGPPGRTGRDQLAAARAFAASWRMAPPDVVVVACDRGAAALPGTDGKAAALVYRVQCAGSLHTSVIELLLRAGASGVLVLACPPRDCWNREGATWLEARMYHDREAELQARVDRRRVRLAHVAAGERARALAELRSFRAGLGRLETDAGIEEETELIGICEAPAASAPEVAAP